MWEAVRWGYRKLTGEVMATATRHMRRRAALGARWGGGHARPTPGWGGVEWAHSIPTGARAPDVVTVWVPAKAVAQGLFLVWDHAEGSWSCTTFVGNS